MALIRAYIGIVKRIWHYVVVVSKAVVSIIPARKLYTSTTYVKKLTEYDEKMIKNTNKYYHHPRSKPVSEQQSLLKENKKRQKH